MPETIVTVYFYKRADAGIGHLDEAHSSTMTPHEEQNQRSQRLE